MDNKQIVLGINVLIIIIIIYCMATLSKMEYLAYAENMETGEKIYFKDLKEYSDWVEKENKKIDQRILDSVVVDNSSLLSINISSLSSSS